MKHAIERGAVATAMVGALFLSGCADFSGIAPKATLKAPQMTGLPTSDAQGTVTADWWRGMGDAQLDHLIDQALQNNPSLQVAQARETRAQAVAGLTDSARWPQASAELDLTRQRFSAESLYPPPYGGAMWNTGTLQLNVGWELDFFGKHRAALDAALGEARAATIDAQAARVLLASQVARTYVQWARLQDQLQVAERTLAQRQALFDLVRERVAAGLDTELELRQSQGALPEARQQIEAVKEQVALTRNALAALVGIPASDLPGQLPTLAALHPLAMAPSIPADWLGHRADVTAARWRVEAGLGNVAQAKSQFYPNVNLVAFAGVSSLGLDRLFNSGAQEYGAGPAINLPIFNGGRLRSQLGVRTADLDAAIASYNATLLDAVRDVADQIASSQSVLRQQQEQQAAQQAAESAYAIALQRYEGGLGNYLQVLSAETTVLNQRRLAVDLGARRLDTQLGLVRALGGGLPPLPQPTAAAHS